METTGPEPVSHIVEHYGQPDIVQVEAPNEETLRIERKVRARALEVYAVLVHQSHLMEQTADTFDMLGRYPKTAQMLRAASTRGAILIRSLRGY